MNVQLSSLSKKVAQGELGPNQLVARVDIHQLGGGFGRILETFENRADGSNDSARVEIEEIGDELIGMLRLDSKGRKGLLWKVFQVVGDDDVGVRMNRGRKYMAVIGVGQTDAFDGRLLASNQWV